MKYKFTDKAEKALSNSLLIAREIGHTYIGTEHLLLSLCNQKGSISKKILDEKKIPYTIILEKIKEISGVGEFSYLSEKDITPKLKEIIIKSSKMPSDNIIGTEHLLYSICDTKDCFAYKILIKCSTSPQEIKHSIEKYQTNEISEQTKVHSNKDTLNTKNKFPTLSLYGKNLIENAYDVFDPVICRDKEIERTILTLMRRSKNNPALIGEPGVGKTAIVEGIARKIATGDVPDELKDKTIFSLDLSSILAGAKYRGEFEDRLKSIIDEISGNKKIILFVDEMHMIIGAGAAEGALDAANILKPSLARGDIQLIGATTLDEYRKHIEKDSALERRFQPIIIKEPSVEDAKKMLFALRNNYENFHKIKISDDAIIAACELSSLYINDRYLPDKAIDLIDEAASKIKYKSSASYMINKPNDHKSKLKSAIINSDTQKAKEIYESEILSNKEKHKEDILTLTREDIAMVIHDITNINTNKLNSTESEDLVKMEAGLKSIIIGQDDAINKVCTYIRRARTGLKDKDRPVGCFMFVGKTGVGKTALAKALSEKLFTSKGNFIRFDMSEFKEAHSISKLIGSPPGYVGYKESGHLCETVRRNPYSILLFDEIEKAHRDITDLLLQIMDYGELSDSSGKKINFKNTIIIMTSNCGANNKTITTLGFNDSIKENNYIHSLKERFGAEYLARLDAIIEFSDLDIESFKKISKNKLCELQAKLKNNSITMTFGEDVIYHIAKKAQKMKNNARGIINIIEREIGSKISDMLINAEIKTGDTVNIEIINDDICFCYDKK